MLPAQMNSPQPIDTPESPAHSRHGGVRKFAARHASKLRFGIVGTINTALDFGILFILTHFGLPTLAANFISTTTAFSFSFFANKHFTFRSSGGNLRRQVGLFLAVTLFGLWVLQPIVIVVVQALVRGMHLDPALSLFIAKLAATGVSLVWNYLFYSRLVFKSDDKTP